MYITNELFVNKSLAAGASGSDLLEVLDIIKSLFKKYGNRLKLTHIKESVSEVAPEIADFVLLLDKHDKLGMSEIDDLLRIVKKHTTDREKQFVVISPDRKEQIVKKLEDKYGKVTISTQETDKTGLYVSGEGYYYKRSLEKDLDTLLS